MTTYAEKMANEVRNYERLFAGRMHQDTPPVWDAVEECFADRLERQTGARNLYQYVARHLEGRPNASILGLGSGACGNELDGIAPLLKSQGCELSLTCVDINPAILDQAGTEAEQRGVRFEGLVMDINQIKLPERQYDIIVAYASLHHFLELDHIAEQCNRALRPEGLLVTVDIPTRNGYRMWPETETIVNSLLASFPKAYRVDHTRAAEPVEVTVLENVDHSQNSFECINSEAILPALRKRMKEVDYVPAFSLARRFFDTKFGPNYDLSRPLDRSMFQFVMELDEHYLDTEVLKPETFFGAYAPRL